MTRGGRTVKKILSELGYIAAIAAFLWLAWQLAAMKAASEFIVPKPTVALKTFWKMLGEATVYKALRNTLARTLIAFGVSFVAALAAALLGERFPAIRRLLSPVVSVLRTLPTMAVTLLLVIWAGRRRAPVIIALLVILPTIYAAMTSALSGVDRNILDMARVDGAKGRTLVLGFCLPLALPAFALPVAASLSLCLKLIVAAEVLAGTAAGTNNTLGSAMQMAALYYETARLMALTVLTVIVGLVLEKLAYAVLRLLAVKFSS